MPTMPAFASHPQPGIATQWFPGPAGQALLVSERTVVADALAAHPVVGLPWLWLAPDAPDVPVEGKGMRLAPRDGRWQGPVHCRQPLPIASESLGAIVLQHVLCEAHLDHVAWLEECHRLLVPGGRLALIALNPLSPYRLRWRGRGLRAFDPSTWRRALHEAGFSTEPSVQGIGPQWSTVPSPSPQSGPGLRAACILRAEKRAIPLNPIRARKPLGLADGLPVALGLPSHRAAQDPLRKPSLR